jgi:hypothetical protein
MSSNRDEVEKKDKPNKLIRMPSSSGAMRAGACALDAPDDLFERLKQRGLHPLEECSVFLKDAPARCSRLACDTDLSPSDDEADEKRTSKNKDDLRYTKMLFKRFPYSFSSIRHAMCFPFTFAMQPERWSKVVDQLKDAGEYGPIKLQIPRTAIEAQWGDIMNFKKGEYHLVPLEVRTLRVCSKNVPLRLAYRLLTEPPKDAVSNGGVNYESPCEWTFSNRVISGVSSRIPNGIIPACGEALDEKDCVTWRADVDVIRSDRAQMMKFFKLDQLMCHNPSSELTLTYPRSVKSRIEDVLAWIMIAENPDPKITRIWMRDAGQFIKDKEDDDGDNDDDDQEESDDEDEEDDDDDLNKHALVKKFDRNVTNTTVQRVLQDINNPKTLMSLDDGLTLEVVPAVPGGWNVLRQEVLAASRLSHLASANANQYDPNMQLCIDIGIVAIPIVASPPNVSVPSHQAIPVGFAPRHVSSWVASPQ